MLPQSNVVTANNTSSTVQFSQVPERNMRAQSVTQVRNITKNCLLQKSASELNVKQLGQQDGPWLRIVPSYQVRPRNCDEIPEEFKRAGIGLCFGGKQKLSPCTSPYFSNALCIYRAKNGFGLYRWRNLDTHNNFLMTKLAFFRIKSTNQTQMKAFAEKLLICMSRFRLWY